MDTEAIERKLLQYAADIANRDPLARPYGEVFREANHRSGPNLLSLVIEPTVALHLSVTSQHVVMDELHEVAVTAFQQAMSEHPDLVGELIIANARKGINYFEKFDA